MVVRWVLLEGSRYAVTVVMLALVFSTIVTTGIVWTFEMQRLLTETSTVQTVLNTFMSGIILLVSIVVSINAIALSHDITSVGTQEERVEGVVEFRREVGQETQQGWRPTDPNSFLEGISPVIREHTEMLLDEVEGTSGEFAQDVHEYVDRITDDLEEFDDIEDDGAEFGVLWRALEFEYGTYIDRARLLEDVHGSEMSESFEEQLADLVNAFELFATGREYFKTMYYSEEVSRLSRALLVVSLPAILATASAILAIDAGLLPSIWVFGLPPLQIFVATIITISLIPFTVLTSYMLRLTTVAIRSVTGGPFSLRTS